LTDTQLAEVMDAKLPPGYELTDSDVGSQFHSSPIYGILCLVKMRDTCATAHGPSLQISNRLAKVFRSVYSVPIGWFASYGHCPLLNMVSESRLAFLICRRPCISVLLPVLHSSDVRTHGAEAEECRPSLGP
jgi:hypothetical protein